MGLELLLRWRARAVLSLSLLASTGLFSAGAGADEIDRCLASHPEAQRLRRDGKLRASRAELLVCARPVCPSVVRTECGRWLAEVDALMPAVVISARTPGGEDLTDVRVIVDGAPALTRLDGRPLVLDPGQHRVRVEATGRASEEQTFLITEGDTARPLLFTLMGDADREPLPGPRPRTEPQSSHDDARRPVPASVVILGGVTAVALASFAFFGLTGRSDYFDLKNICSPDCSASQDAPVRNRFLAADISLAVAVVAVGLGTTLFLTRPTVGSSSSAPELHLYLHASAGGVAGSAGWIF